MNEIMNIAIGSITIGSIIIFLGKLIINKGFDVAIKSFENQLDIMKIEHQIKYSKLHEERAILLKEFYKELYTLEKNLEHYTSDLQGSEWVDDIERKSNAINQLIKCRDILESNRIYFSVNFCKEIENNFDQCTEVINNMEKAKRKEKSRINQRIRGVYNNEGESPIDIWEAQRLKVNTEIKKRRIEIAESFKVIIGVEN